jgi:hypothetical protein
MSQTSLSFEDEHARVLNRAHQIFLDKSPIRGQMWLEFPPSDKIRELRERVTRLENGYPQIISEDTTLSIQEPNGFMREVLIEDALDIINYAAFFIKQIERGQRG